MSDTERLRKAIDDCCRVQRYSYTQLAAASGVGYQTIYKFQKGYRDSLTLKNVGKLAKVFGYDTATLLAGRVKS